MCVVPYLLRLQLGATESWLLPLAMQTMMSPQ